MPDTALDQQTPAQTAAPAASDAPQTPVGSETQNILAQNLWALADPNNPNPTMVPAPAATTPPAQTPPAAPPATPPPAAAATTPPVPPAPDEEIVDVDEIFNREFGMGRDALKAKWTELNKPPQPPEQQEVKWTYDPAREDEVYKYIHQKKQLDRLEQMNVQDANQAAEILRANIQFKHPELTSQQVDRLFARQYSMPAKPTQALDQTDGDYSVAVAAWEAQVRERQEDLILDAVVAKPELMKFKSAIVQPEAPKWQQPNQPPAPDPAVLAAQQENRNTYLGALEAKYKDFKGFNVTAKSGDVQLPVSFNISPEEQVASRALIENFNLSEFIDQRWFADVKNPNINQIQEDLYLLMNRDKIFQAIANEVASKMHEHALKADRNTNLTHLNGTAGQAGVNAPSAADSNQELGAKLWAI